MRQSTDEILREVYEAKDRPAKVLDYDLQKIYEDERRKEAESGRVYLQPPAKPRA